MMCFFFGSQLKQAEHLFQRITLLANGDSLLLDVLDTHDGESQRPLTLVIGIDKSLAEQLAQLSQAQLL